MTNHILIILIALVFATSSLSVRAVSCNKADRAVLIAFKDSFPNSKNDSFHYSYPDWDASSTNDCCNWNYVTCDDSTGRVIALSFSFYTFNPPGMNLNGTVPGVLGNLTELIQIKFNGMQGLVGPIPPQMSKLKKLEILYIADCEISGSIPSFLSQLPSLQQIFLTRTKLVGKIPPSLANLANLSSLSLHANQLSGDIPPNLFSKLSKPSSVYLDLSNNKFKGSMPQSLGNVELTVCYLNNNKFTGDASSLFGRNKTSQTILLYSNKFRFDLSNIEYPLTLTSLDINENEIYGSISNQITEVPNLSNIGFRYNNLCGKIPSIGHFRTFDAWYFEHNKCLCGAPLKPC